MPFECTNEEGVYAIGDVTGKLDLTPVSPLPPAVAFPIASSAVKKTPT